jgi:hypothetical protein
MSLPVNLGFARPYLDAVVFTKQMVAVDPGVASLNVNSVATSINIILTDICFSHGADRKPPAFSHF